MNERLNNKGLTVGQLRGFLDGVPDDAPVATNGVAIIKTGVEPCLVIDPQPAIADAIRISRQWGGR